MSGVCSGEGMTHVSYRQQKGSKCLVVSFSKMLVRCFFFPAFLFFDRPSVLEDVPPNVDELRYRHGTK